MNKSTQPHLHLNAPHLPDAPSWWPLASGWWLTIGILLCLTLGVLLYLRLRQKKLRSKKVALALFSSQQLSPSSAMELLRQATLSYYPRKRIAKLHGEGWYQFLDSQTNQPRFVEKQSQWQQALYNAKSLESMENNSQQLIDDCQQWVAQALPPKRKGRE